MARIEERRLTSASAWFAVATVLAATALPAPVKACRYPVPKGARQILLTEANAKSIWTTSVYSYAPGGGGPGGGLADDRLRIGGWGDTYVALLRFDLPDRRRVRRATLHFTVKADDPRSRPTSMMVSRILRPWSWRAGDRLWWRDRPPTHPEFPIDAPSGEEGSHYEIDLTHLYNRWASGAVPNHGIALEPLWTDNAFTSIYGPRYEGCAPPRLFLTY